MFTAVNHSYDSYLALRTIDGNTSWSSSHQQLQFARQNPQSVGATFINVNITGILPKDKMSVVQHWTCPHLCCSASTLQSLLELVSEKLFPDSNKHTWRKLIKMDANQQSKYLSLWYFSCLKFYYLIIQQSTHPQQKEFPFLLQKSPNKIHHFISFNTMEKNIIKSSEKQRSCKLYYSFSVTKLSIRKKNK